VERKDSNVTETRLNLPEI